MMTQNSIETSSAREMTAKWMYRLIMFFLALSGFGQMPIYKRYYIADIPGLKWTGDFYITHYVHYLAVIIFLGFISYKITDYFLAFRKKYFISTSGYIRAVWIAGIVFTGACLVINNFTGTWFSAGFIIFLDLAHIGFVMLLFLIALYCKISKKKWMMARQI